MPKEMILYDKLTKRNSDDTRNRWEDRWQLDLPNGPHLISETCDDLGEFVRRYVQFIPQKTDVKTLKKLEIIADDSYLEIGVPVRKDILTSFKKEINQERKIFSNLTKFLGKLYWTNLRKLQENQLEKVGGIIIHPPKDNYFHFVCYLKKKDYFERLYLHYYGDCGIDWGKEHFGPSSFKFYMTPKDFSKPYKDIMEHNKLFEENKLFGHFALISKKQIEKIQNLKEMISCE